MRTIYQCEVCRTNYEVPAAAQACEAQGVPTNIKVGDIIEKHDGYGWHNGDDAWVIHDRGKFHDVPTRNFFWLVIDIKPGRSTGNHHCNEVTCVTRGVVNGLSVNGEGVWGITQFNHYIDPRFNGNNPVPIPNPPAKVREEADAFMRRGYVIGTDDKGMLTVKKEEPEHGTCLSQEPEDCAARNCNALGRCQNFSRRSAP
jgi:hypothetical protein